MSVKADAIAICLGGGVLLAGAWYAKKKAGEALTTAKPYVDPTDPRNLAYSGVNALGTGMTGDSNWTLGGWIYDITHPNDSTPAPTQKTDVPPGFTIPEDFGVINPAAGW